MQQPKIGGEVRPHQDSTFLRTDPPSVIGLWWALEDSTKQNGCLWALPGIHKQGVARHFLRKWASLFRPSVMSTLSPKQAVRTILGSALISDMVFGLVLICASHWDPGACSFCLWGLST